MYVYDYISNVLSSHLLAEEIKKVQDKLSVIIITSRLYVFIENPVSSDSTWEYL